MKIIGADILEYSRRLDGRSWNPVSRWIERRAPLLVLHADNGASGIGEAWSRQDRIQPGLEALADYVLAYVVGNAFADDAAIRALAGRRSEAGWTTCAAASAADIALWDLLAKSRGEPLWRTLGGATGRVRVYASGGLYRDGAGVAELAADVASYVRDGFLDVKIKVGGMPLDVDVERISVARNTIAAGAELWVDAVNQLTTANAGDHARAYVAAGASALQAPVAFCDVDTMASIQRRVLPVIAAESAFARSEFESLLAANAVGLLQFNLGLCGGFSGAAELTAAAAQRSVRVTPQAHATSVLQAAALHFGAAEGNTHSVECHRFHDHLWQLLDESQRTVRDGHIRLSDEPGLGITVPMPGVQPDAGVIRVFRAL